MDFLAQVKQRVKNQALYPGRDNIPDKILGMSFRVPCMHKILSENGLSKLINTGHHSSLRVDIRGLYLKCSPEEAEDLMRDSISSVYPVDTVTAIQRADGCSLLFDFRSMAHFKDEDCHKAFLNDVQRRSFDFLSTTHEEFQARMGSSWEMEAVSPFFRRFERGMPSPGLSSYEGSLHD